jgi:multiple sugar transport system substrate-binding protein
VAVHYSNLQDPEVNRVHQGLQNTMLSVLKTARTEPLIPEWPQVESVLEVAINNMAGGKSVKETLDQAAKDVEAIMKKGGYYK